MQDFNIFDEIEEDIKPHLGKQMENAIVIRAASLKKVGGEHVFEGDVWNTFETNLDDIEAIKIQKHAKEISRPQNVLALLGTNKIDHDRVFTHFILIDNHKIANIPRNESHDPQFSKKPYHIHHKKGRLKYSLHYKDWDRKNLEETTFQVPVDPLFIWLDHHDPKVLESRLLIAEKHIGKKRAEIEIRNSKKFQKFRKKVLKNKYYRYIGESGWQKLFERYERIFKAVKPVLENVLQKDPDIKMNFFA